MEELPAPKKLGARTKRKIEDKNLDTYTIKCGLDKALCIDSNFKISFVEDIKKRVTSVSKATHKLSILMNVFIRECLEKSRNPFNIVIPTFLSDKDTTFARQMMLGQEKTRKSYKVLTAFLHKYQHLTEQYPVKRYQGDANSFVRAAETYLTNYKTYLSTNFEKKQIAFISLWLEKHDIDIKFTRHIRYLVNGWDFSRLKNRLNLLQMTEKMTNFISFQKKLLHIQSDEKLDDSWLKTNYETIIVYYSVMSKYFKKRGKRQVMLAPLCKIRSKFLHIDTDVFHGILKGLNITQENKFFVRENKDLYYNQVFKINKLLTSQQLDKGFKFTGTVMTDGCALNILFKRPKLIANTTPQQLDRNDPNIRVIANDPGRSTLFCGIEKLEDGTYKNYSLTRNHFHTVSGAKKATKNANRWNNECLKKTIEEMSQTNSRSVHLVDFLKYVKSVNDNYIKLWDEYLKKRYSRQRFSLYSGKKKAYDTFFKSLGLSVNENDTRQTIIAYGDAGFASNSKYEIAAPTTALETQCKKWFKVVKVDEFRTTQVHNETKQRLCHVNMITQNETEKQVRKVRGLLWYRKTSQSSKFINRDINAAKNILECYRMHPERPTEMKRETEAQEIPKAHYIMSKTKLVSIVQDCSLSLEHQDLARFNFYKN